jgi:hypothetical protein
MFTGKNPFKIMRQTWNPGGWEIETLEAPRVMTHDDAQMIAFDPNDVGHRVVTLPAPRKGAWFWIFNHAGAAENLLLRQADGTTVVGTVNQDESALVFCPADDEDEGAAGWLLLAVVAISLS